MASATWQSSSHSRCASQVCVLCSFNHSLPQALPIHLMQDEMPSSQTQGFISSWQLVSPEICMTYFNSVSCAGISEGSLGFFCWFALIQRQEGRGFWAGPWCRSSQAVEQCVSGVTQWGMKAPASSASWGAVVCFGEGIPISQATPRPQKLLSKFSVVLDISRWYRVWQTLLLVFSYRPRAPSCSSQVEYLLFLGIGDISHNKYTLFQYTLRTGSLNYSPHR